jgi:O-antigen/teichoic acid export membrane protein
LSAPRGAPAEERAEGHVRGLNTVVGDVTSITGSRVATLLLGAATVILTARLLTPAGYAVLAYMTLGATLMLYLAAGWSGAAVMRYGREELERTGGMPRTAWARFILTGPILVALGAGLIALKSAGVLPAEFAWRFVWLTLALGVFTVLSEQWLVILDAAGRMRFSAAAAAGRQALLVAGLLAIAAGAAAPTTMSVAWLTLGVAALLAVGLAIALRGLALWPPSVDRAQLRRLLVFSLPLIAFSASQYGMRSVDIVVLRAYRPPSDVGIYALAYQAYLMLQTLATTATVVLIPLFVSLREAGRSHLIAHYFERLAPQAMLATCAVGGAMAPLAYLCVPLVFGSDFADAARPLTLLVAALVLFTIASLVAPILMLYERTAATSAINVAALVLNIVGDLVLVGWLDMGVAGPAIATGASLALIACGYVAVARRDMRTAPKIPPLIFSPLLAGILPPVLLPAAVGVPVGFAAAVAFTALVLWRVPLFSEQDAGLVARLDLPESVRVRVVRAITRLAR